MLLASVGRGWRDAQSVGLPAFALLALLGFLLLVVLDGHAAAACPNEGVREEQNKPWLTNCRAYELVSPQEKAAQDVRRTFSSLRSSADGEKVTYTAFGSFPIPSAEGANWVSRYLANRDSGAGGIPWLSRPIDSKQDPQFLSFVSLAAAYQNLQTPESFTDDLTVSIEQNYQVQLDPTLPTDPLVVNLFRRDYSDDSYRMLTPTVGPPLPWLFTNGLPEFIAGTSDMGKIVFETQQTLTPEFEDTSVVKLYEWDQGTVRLVGVLPEDEGGGPSPSGSVGAGGIAVGKPSLTAQQRGSRPGVMSADGSRVFFLEGNGESGRLLMREDNGQPSARTLWISKSERTSPEATQPATFWAADPTGTQVTFSTAESLVDGDTDTTADVYRYDLSAPEGGRLTQISKGDAPAEFEGVIGSAVDQSSVYFVAVGALTGDAPADSSKKLYLWSHDALRYVGSLATSSGNEFISRNWGGYGSDVRVARVSDDGRYVVFLSSSQMTDYDNEGFDQFYLFDADAPAGSAITCISCKANGSAPTANATIGHRDGSNSATPYQPRFLVDGSGAPRIFFESYDAVVPQDQNGKRDVYEYNGSTRTVSLLSSGADGEDSFFMDADDSGANVFIATRAQLTGWDRDPLYDVYDVRIGGGVSEPPIERPCLGDECQGPAGSPPVALPPATSTLVGPGNVKSRGKAKRKGKRCTKVRKAARKCQKRNANRQRRDQSEQKGGKR